MICFRKIEEEVDKTEAKEVIKGTIKTVQGRFEEGLTWPQGKEEKKCCKTDLEDRAKYSREAH